MSGLSLLLDSRRVPQLSHVLLSGEGLPVVSADGLGEGQVPVALALRQVCRVVRQMTGEMMDFTAERIQLRRDRRRLEIHIRQIAMYVCHVSLRLSQADVGFAFGRDRTTVSHACAAVEDRRDSPAYDDFVSAVERVATAMFQPMAHPVPPAPSDGAPHNRASGAEGKAVQHG